MPLLYGIQKIFGFFYHHHIGIPHRGKTLTGKNPDAKIKLVNLRI